MKNILLKYFLEILLGCVVILFTYLMAGIIFPYLSGRTDIGFLLTKQHIIHLFQYRFAFYFHIYSSLLVLLAGGVQFSDFILRNYRSLHRLVGKMYVFLILFVTGPAALFMSFYGNGGLTSQSSFIALSVLWWGVTFIAFKKVKLGDIQGHKAFMIRSYALTLSAITLRIGQMLIGYFNWMNPYDAYLFLSWFSWMSNLLIAEVILFRQRKLIAVSV